MWKAMVFKELRETGWMALLALALGLWLVISLTGTSLVPYFGSGRGATIPFVGDGFYSYFAYLCAGLTIALGFRQTATESLRNTWQFLLHRPVDRRRLVVAKLLTGAALYLAVLAVPVLLYAWWASAPGHHASPFRWSMTLPVWQLWLSMTAIYLAAFLSGLRPGRWFGSRLLPLLAAIVPVVLVQTLPWRWVLGLALLALVVLAYCGLILFVARTRDYS